MPLTPLVGRASELATLAEMLGQAGPRLITLLGPGGVGKSRLALHAANLARYAFERVALIELAQFREPEFVLPAIAQALGVPEVADSPLASRLSQALAHQKTLLVIDNFEQVVAASPTLADLLAHTPELHALVTSRALLNIHGEQEFPVLPLKLPPRFAMDVNLSRHAALRYSAVALFMARGRLANPTLRLTDRNAADVVAICRRLDGLPLALELAAAWLRLVSVPELRKLVEQRLPVLAGGPRNQPPRLRSMQAAIAWSFDLLDPAEQRIFRLLSVFEGGFTLEMARILMIDVEPGVQVVPERIETANILLSLASLAAHSLLHRAEDSPGMNIADSRFSMLETLRDFGLIKLEEFGESLRVKRAHARLFLQLAERAEQELVGPSERAWATVLESELQNLRAAFAWLLEDDPGSAIRLAAALWQFWYRTGRLEEGEAYLGRALDRLENESLAIHGKGLFVWGALAGARGDLPVALTRLTEARTLLSPSDDNFSLALTETSLGIYSLYGGDPASAVLPLQRAATLYPLVSTPSSAALGPFSGFQLAVAEYTLAPSAASLSSLEDAAQAVRAAQSDLLRLPMLSVLASVYWNGGDLQRATKVWREALAVAWEAGERWLAVDPLYGLAAAAATHGDLQAGLELLGALDSCLAATGISAMIAGVMTESVTDLAARHLASAEITRLRLAGAQKPLAQVVHSLLVDAFPRPAHDIQERTLSARERDVLRLLADGRSDPEIAAALFVSRRTVATHVANLYRKLGVHSRAAASAAAVRGGLV